MPSQVKILPTELTVINASKKFLPDFSYGIISIITGVWQDKYIKQQRQTLFHSKNNCNFESPVKEFVYSDENESDSDTSTGRNYNDNNTVDDDYNDFFLTDYKNKNNNAYFSGELSSDPSSYGSSVSVISFIPQQFNNSSKHHVRTDSADDNTNFDLSASQETFSENQLEKKIEQLETYFGISITPNEISIICPTEVVGLLFGEFLKSKNGAVVTMNKFTALQIDDFDTRYLVNSLKNEGHAVMLLPSHFSDYLIIPIAAKGMVEEHLKSMNFHFYFDSECYVQSEIVEDWGFFQQYQVNESKKIMRSDMLGIGMPAAEIFGQLELDLIQANLEKDLSISDNAILVLTGQQLQGISKEIKDGLELDIIKKLASSPEYLLVSLTNSTELSLITESELIKDNQANIWVKGRTYLRPVKVNDMVTGISEHSNKSSIGMSTMNEMWVLLETDLKRC